MESHIMNGKKVDEGSSTTITTSHHMNMNMNMKVKAEQTSDHSSLSSSSSSSSSSSDVTMQAEPTPNNDLEMKPISPPPQRDIINSNSNSNSNRNSNSNSNSNSNNGYGDDLFAMYFDMDKPSSPSKPHHGRSFSMDPSFAFAFSHSNELNVPGKEIPITPPPLANLPRPPHHRHCSSMDASSMLPLNNPADGLFGSSLQEMIEPKKVMSSDKLAELALLDPKRAKRILANRQSAARSKERKTHYITDLERKVQTLQTEATTLSAHFRILQRDTAGLTAENHELKLRLQSMEQQSQLRHALNDALMEELQRLRMATGEGSDSTNIGHMLFPDIDHPLLVKQQIFQFQRSLPMTMQQIQQVQSNSVPTEQLNKQQNFVQSNSFGSLDGFTSGVGGSIMT